VRKKRKKRRLTEATDRSSRINRISKGCKTTMLKNKMRQKITKIRITNNNSLATD
jgi:hypothetical protein